MNQSINNYRKYFSKIQRPIARWYSHGGIQKYQQQKKSCSVAPALRMLSVKLKVQLNSRRFRFEPQLQPSPVCYLAYKQHLQKTVRFQRHCFCLSVCTLSKRPQLFQTGELNWDNRLLSQLFRIEISPGSVHDCGLALCDSFCALEKIKTFSPGPKSWQKLGCAWLN